MPVGYFKSVPKVDIQFERDSYRPGDELRAKITVHTNRPGMSVRRAVVDLVLENRYTQSSVVSVMDPRGGASAMRGGPAPKMSNQRITQDRIDRNIIGQERLFADGVIRHRTETFNLRFDIKPPPARRTTEQRLAYLISVHFDLPRMRDVETHRAVPVQI